MQRQPFRPRFGELQFGFPKFPQVVWATLRPAPPILISRWGQVEYLPVRMPVACDATRQTAARRRERRLLRNLRNCPRIPPNNDPDSFARPTGDSRARSRRLSLRTVSAATLALLAGAGRQPQRTR